MENYFGQSVDKLPTWGKLALGAALVERMAANYALFSEAVDFGSADSFNAMLALVWEYASGSNSRIDFDKQLSKLELISPEPERFPVYGVYPALDACTALGQLMQQAMDPEHESVAVLAELSFSTIAQYLTYIEYQSSYEHHPLWLSEGDFISQVSRLAQSLADDRRGCCAALRRLARAQECSNIGICLQ